MRSSRRHPSLGIDERDEWPDVLVPNVGIGHLLPVRRRLDGRVGKKSREIALCKSLVRQVRAEVAQLAFDSNLSMHVTGDTSRGSEQSPASFRFTKWRDSQFYEMLSDCAVHFRNRIDDSPGNEHRLAAAEPTVDRYLPLTRLRKIDCAAIAPCPMLGEFPGRAFDGSRS